jgi:hypothetical protein
VNVPVRSPPFSHVALSDMLPRVTVLAHIAGIPVEESLLSLGPVGLLGVSLAVRSVLARFRRPQESSQ